MGKGKAINLTFKNNKEELELFAWVRKHTNYSGFIKDVLIQQKEKEDEEKKKAKTIKFYTMESE